MIQIVMYVFLGIIFGVVIIGIGKMIAVNIKSRKCPRVTVAATVIKKNTTYYGGSRPSTPSYSVVFEVDTGDRKEFRILHSYQFSALNEGSEGLLTFRGMDYIEFNEVI